MTLSLPTRETQARARDGMAPPRWEFVDGLRALCALFVVEHHIYYELLDNPSWANIDPALRAATGWLVHGYISVAGFIVLSGFCLMLPVVSSKTQELVGGIKEFIARRAKRILPPYYAALALSILLLIIVPGFNHPSGYHWDWSLPGLKGNSIISHLLLLHNLNPNWLTKINHPLWSIAIEWQIYFVFAFLLLPIRKRFNLVASVAAAFALGILPGMLFHTGDWTRPWYIGLFSLGMVSAVVARSNDATSTWFRTRLPWGALTLLAAGAEIYCASAQCGQLANEIATAVMLTCCLTWGATFNRERATAIGKAFMSALTWSTLVKVGLYSYSIYLIHAPVIALMRMILVSLALSPTQVYIALLGLGTAASVGIGYLFFLAIERRFITKRQQA